MTTIFKMNEKKCEVIKNYDQFTEILKVPTLNFFFKSKFLL